MLLIYAVINWFSFDCEQADPKVSRPLLLVMSLFYSGGLGVFVGLLEADLESADR